ncbi:MAG TPA: alkaline phosphatase D family protein [Sphingobacteriaceae bacterium]|nr:alkaline phosphatase D family protein [Sphingobacteriaceae bacterium]
MNLKNNRRRFLKKLGIGFGALSFSGITNLVASKKTSYIHSSFKIDFSAFPDRTWLDESLWAIPMEDWTIKDGKLQFKGKESNSRVNVLTTVIGIGPGSFEISSDMGIKSSRLKNDGSAGFRIGIKDALDNDVKAACYYGKGISTGVSAKGYLFIGDKKLNFPLGFDLSAIKLKLTCNRTNALTDLVLSCKNLSGSKIQLNEKLEEDVDGLIAIANNMEVTSKEPFWFSNVSMQGSKLTDKPENSFGPILWAMHTLSKRVLKLSAQMPPLGQLDNQSISLQLKKVNSWQTVQTQTIDKLSKVAVFRLDKWEQKKDIDYRLVYKNLGKTSYYSGIIRKEPLDRPLVFAGLTCQEWGGYPYSPLIKNLSKHNPDMLYFSGDQLYERNGGYPIKREPVGDSILSFLGKWYMFGWAFRDLMRNRPTICTPDDHDVFQGNMWGEGGKLVTVDEWENNPDSRGGYVQSLEMINVVHQTNCGHMPDAFDNEPLTSGITTWHTDLVYGKTSFAIISDRMFKSGPQNVRKGNGRIDHIKEPLTTNELERPDLELLGKRQMNFLDHWVNDWTGANMKVLLSQTLFSNVSTHHGDNKMFLHGDMDSDGWPKTKRDEVLRLIRKGYVFHINGDQHLPFIVQYSLDKKRDAGWTFCTPAISTGYIRWGAPDLENLPYTDRPSHNLPNTGCYKDVFGNENYVYAVGNPADKYQDNNRYKRAQNKSSGFGLITFNTKLRTIQMDAYRFLANKDKPGLNDQFPGWPLTINQTDNDGRETRYFLPKILLNKPDQVIKITSVLNNKLINVIRSKGNEYQHKVSEKGKYTIQVGEGKSVKIFSEVEASDKPGKVIQYKV